jgi:hypothetical protein
LSRDGIFRRNKELWLALAAIIIVSVGYFSYMAAFGLLPPASNLLGHGIGILGFVLMLMTEILYTLRKRAKSARWGRVESWLKFHVFTGLVGPYMVLLHPALRFQGVALILTLLTVVVVASGVVGRYIYTRVPRAIENEAVGRTGVPPAGAAGTNVSTYSGIPVDMTGLAERDARVAAARRGLAIWRTVHVPLTFVLFAVAVVHIVGAVYYATLLH